MIELIRGDSLSLKFQRKDPEGQPITTEADEVFFTVKKNTTTEEYILQKTIEDMTFEDGTYHITILPEDTEELDYGSYVYDLEVCVGTDYKKTIAIGEFKIKEEVTFASNEYSEE
jgi:hypothetical protein